MWAREYDEKVRQHFYEKGGRHLWTNRFVRECPLPFSKTASYGRFPSYSLCEMFLSSARFRQLALGSSIPACIKAQSIGLLWHGPACFFKVLLWADKGAARTSTPRPNTSACRVSDMPMTLLAQGRCNSNTLSFRWIYIFCETARRKYDILIKDVLFVRITE